MKNYYNNCYYIISFIIIISLALLPLRFQSNVPWGENFFTYYNIENFNYNIYNIKYNEKSKEVMH